MSFDRYQPVIGQVVTMLETRGSIRGHWIAPGRDRILSRRGWVFPRRDGAALYHVAGESISRGWP